MTETEVLHVSRATIERAVAAADDQRSRYWCWLRPEWEEAEALGRELSGLLGNPRERREWPR